MGSIVVYTIFLQFFTGFHSMQHGDSLMLSIMSYTKPTLYYWGQDKYFNFLPIMFSFIKNPMCNLLLMSAFQLVMVILFPFFACKALLLDDTFTFGIITLSCLAIFPGTFWFEICYQPYVQSIFLVTVSIWFYSRCSLTVSAAQRGVMLLLSAFFALIAMKVADPSVSIFIIWSLLLSYDPNFINKQDNAQIEDSHRAKHKVGLYVFLMSVFGSFYVVSAIIDKLYVKTYYIILPKNWTEV
jgi:hypothetical protein